MSLFHRLVRGSAVNLIEHGLKLGLMFVVTPLMVKYLSQQDYGLWLLTLSIISYFYLLDIGISLSGSRFLGRALGANDPKDFQSLVSTFFRIFNRIGLIAAAATFALMAILRWIPGLGESAATARWLVLGFGLATAVRFWTRIFQLILKSHVRYDLIGIATITKTAVQGGLIIYFLQAGHGLITLLCIHIGTDLIEHALLILFARKVSPEVRISGKHHNSEKTPELLKYNLSTTATIVGENLRNGIDPLIVSHVSGLASVPVYSIGTRFFTYFQDLINAVFGGNFVAAFSQLAGRDDGSLLKQRFLEVTKLSVAVACTGSAFILIYGAAFIERWVGPEFSDSAQVLWILALPIMLSLMQYPVWGLFYSSGKQHQLAIMTFAGGLFNLTVSLALASKIGFFGVVWGTATELTLAYGLVVPLLVAKMTQLPLSRYLWILFINTIKILIPSALYFLAVRHWILPDYFRLFLLGTAHLVVLSPVLWMLVLRQEERQKLLNFAGLDRLRKP